MSGIGEKHREEGRLRLRGGVSRGLGPGGVPVVPSRWRSRTTDVVRGRSFLLREVPERGGAGAERGSSRNLKGSKQPSHAAIEESVAAWRRPKRMGHRKTGRKFRDFLGLGQERGFRMLRKFIHLHP